MRISSAASGWRRSTASTGWTWPPRPPVRSPRWPAPRRRRRARVGRCPHGEERLGREALGLLVPVVGVACAGLAPRGSCQAWLRAPGPSAGAAGSQCLPQLRVLAGVDLTAGQPPVQDPGRVPSAVPRLVTAPPGACGQSVYTPAGVQPDLADLGFHPLGARGSPPAACDVFDAVLARRSNRRAHRARRHRSAGAAAGVPWSGLLAAT